ncbi:hypothetical protein Tco_1148714 [Tanacetum coccineum]
MMMGTKSDIEKFDGKNDFALWQVRMKALLEQQGLTACRKRNIRLGGRSRRSSLSKVLWAEDTTMSTYLVTRSPSSVIGLKTPIDMNTGFNESRKYKKTFIGSGVGTGSIQALQGDEFEVEP